MSLERPTGAAVKELASYRRAAKANDALWPPECLASERKFGHRAARLYPLISHTQKADGRMTNGNAVRTPQGIGTLLQVIGGEARVLLLKTKPVLMYRNPDKHGRPTTTFLIEEIEPYVSGTRRKAAR